MNRGRLPGLPRFSRTAAALDLDAAREHEGIGRAGHLLRRCSESDVLTGKCLPRPDAVVHAILDRPEDPPLAEQGKPPRSVIVVKIDVVYFQCSRALMRSGLWNQAADGEATTGLPTAGQILANMTSGEVGGEAYDREWPQRAVDSLW